MTFDEQTFLFIIWSQGRVAEQRILDDLRRNLTVLETREVSWRKRDFIVKLSAFYDERNWWKWFKKAIRCGTGPFLAIKVRDESPSFQTHRIGSLVIRENHRLIALKDTYRKWAGRKWSVHCSIEAFETKRQLSLVGMTETPEPQASPKTCHVC